MALGKINTFINIIKTETIKDSEGFSNKVDIILASIRAYKEDRFASEKWANRATFSEATSLFRFRRLPNLDVTTEMVITCKDDRYEISSVRDIRNRGMYVEVLAKKVKSNLSSVIGKNTKLPSRSTGELLGALGVSPALIDRNGNYNVKVGFSEPRSDGDSNAKIANILEYGKSGQSPKPFLKPAKSAGKKECIEAMKEKLEEEIKGL